MKKTKIMLLGAYGMLGTSLSKFLIKKEYDIYRCGEKKRSAYDFDALDINKLKEIVDQIKPDFIINLIALTNVDLCEKNYNKAFELNSRIPYNISLLSEYYQFNFIHISTDQIYSGKGPHKEENFNPINVYSRSKLEGEKFVISAGGLVLRTNFVGRSFSEERNSFTDWLVLKGKQKKEFKLFDDVIFSPLHLSNLNKFIELSLNNFISGCFNLGSSSYISKAEFGVRFLRNLNYSFDFAKICSIKESLLVAERPLDMSLNIEKVKQNFPWVAPNIDEIIFLCTEEYIN